MKAKRKSSTKKKLLTVLVSFLAVVLTTLLALTVYVEWILGRFYYDPSEFETLSREEIDAQLKDDQGNTLDPNATVLDPDDIELDQVDKVQTEAHILNILLIGQDRRPGEPRMRSDVMLLVTVNTKDKSITMTSFLRDLYVQIPGYYKNRINVAYYLGGAELLFETIEYNFGIRPDKFVEVDFDGFREVVDLVGGIDMNLTETEAIHLNNNEEFYGFPGQSWTLHTGLNRLNGQQALAYARIRRIDPSGDFARTQRQRKLIGALIDKAKTCNLLQLNELLLEMSDMITTDMTSKEILSYAADLYPVLSHMGKVSSLQIPADGAYYFAGIEGIGEVLVPDLDANSQIIASYQD